MVLISKMKKTGIFYSFSTQKTAKIAQLIKDNFGDESITFNFSPTKNLIQKDTKIIAKNGITLGSISKRSFQLKLFLFKASTLPLFHVEKIDHNIKRKTSKSIENQGNANRSRQVLVLVDFHS